MNTFKRLAPLWLLLIAACGSGGDPPPPPVDTSAVAVADPGSALPADWQTSGAFMEIYVRGFKDSDGDGIGDLRGLTQQLDYLQELGVKGIWLMPVTQSQDRDHGYAVSDYRDIEDDYGTLADFDELLAQAHARGIGVIVDYVINHSAAANPLFQNADRSRTSSYRNWYIWSDAHPAGWSIYGNDPWHAGQHGYYFGGFWSQMPDLNLREPGVVAYQNNNLRFWLNRGVDGFRFDAVGNLFENGAGAWENQAENYLHMDAVRQLVGGYSRRYMVCEAPADPPGYGSSCGSAFAFGLNYALVNAAKGQPSGIQYVANYFKTASPMMATMVSNHDSFAGARLYDQVDGDIPSYRMAAATYLTLPGIPFIYYGEEIGMAGGQGLSGDHALRTPLSWTASTSNGGFSSATPFRALSRNVATFNVAAQRADPQSLFHFYKDLLALRSSHPALARGSYAHSSVQGLTLNFQRLSGGDRVLVVLNYGGNAATVTVNNLPANTALTPLYPPGLTAGASDGSGQASIGAGGQTVSIYQF